MCETDMNLQYLPAYKDVVEAIGLTSMWYIGE